MHPILLIPAASIGYLIGKTVTKPRKKIPMGVPLLAWERFIAVMAIAPRQTVSEKGKFGTFQMDARRLKDVGVMKAASKGTRAGVSGVWVGEWNPPLTEREFLGNLPLQYTAFCRSMNAAAPKVSGLVGCEVDGKRVTLSGLLGVCHVAGEGGVESWVTNAEVRRRFTRTGEMFSRTNGIF